MQKDKALKPRNLPLYLAPMAAVSHPALRLLIEKWGGCDYYYSEMISCKALNNRAPFEKWYVETAPDAGKLVFQMVGSTAAQFVESALILKELHPKGLDINMGCCAPEIARQGSGIKLMSQLDKTREIIEKVKEVCEDIPLSAKIRIGEKEDPDYLVHFAKTLEKTGLDAIAINPRTRKDKRSRPAKWKNVSLLKQELTIPVIGNGDLKTPEICLQKAEIFKPDGLMIGQAAVTKPWIFKSTKALIQNEPLNFEVDLRETAYEFRDLLEKYQPPEFQQSRASRFFSYFTENLLFGHRIKGKLPYCETPEKMLNLFDDYFKLNPHEQIQSG